MAPNADPLLVPGAAPEGVDDLLRLAQGLHGLGTPQADLHRPVGFIHLPSEC